MNKEDFDKPIDYIIYKITGAKPKQKHPINKYGLKFRKNGRTNRYSVSHNKTFLCACDENEIDDITNYFNETYNGKNIKKIQKTLKRKYNKKIHHQTYDDANITFLSKKGGRVTARIQHNGKTISICQCNENQKEEVSKTYDTLKRTHNLKQIQEIMKNKYNIQRKPIKNNHNIKLTQNGICYKNNKAYKVNPKLYEIVDAYLTKEKCGK